MQLELWVQLSWGTAISAKWHVRPSTKVSLCEQRSLWSDCKNAQADLNLRRPHRSFLDIATSQFSFEEFRQNRQNRGVFIQYTFRLGRSKWSVLLKFKWFYVQCQISLIYKPIILEQNFIWNYCRLACRSNHKPSISRPSKVTSDAREQSIHLPLINTIIGR